MTKMATTRANILTILKYKNIKNDTHVILTFSLLFLILSVAVLDMIILVCLSLSYLNTISGDVGQLLIRDSCLTLINMSPFESNKWP